MKELVSLKIGIYDLENSYLKTKILVKKHVCLFFNQTKII